MFCRSTDLFSSVLYFICTKSEITMARISKPLLDTICCHQDKQNLFPKPHR